MGTNEKWYEYKFSLTPFLYTYGRSGTLDNNRYITLVWVSHDIRKKMNSSQWKEYSKDIKFLIKKKNYIKKKIK